MANHGISRTDKSSAKEGITLSFGTIQPIAATGYSASLMKLTHQNLHAGGRIGCGFNRKQLEVLGVEWPPTKGWLSSLIGQEIPDEVYAKFLSMKKKERIDIG